MERLTDLFAINGSPLPAPDEKPEVTLLTRSVGASAMDITGFYHKKQERVLEKWSLHYKRLSGEAYAYLRSLLPQGDFFFSRPDADGRVTTLAYAKAVQGKLEDGVSGAYRDVVVEIEEC